MSRIIGSNRFAIVIFSLAAALLAVVLLFPELRQSAIKTLAYIGEWYGRVWPYILIDIGIFTTLMLAEVFAGGWKTSTLYRVLHPRDQNTVHDIVTWVLRTSYILPIGMYILTLGFRPKLIAAVGALFGVQEPVVLPSIESVLLQNLLFLLLLDFILYWAHRLEHRWAFLWPFHKFHHSAEQMNMLTDKRIHPVESHIIRVTFTAILFAVLGAPIETFMIVYIIRTAVGALHHSNFNWSWGWFGKYVIVSPNYHKLHHLNDERYFNRNYAILFPVYDLLFGTWQDPKSVDLDKFGLQDDNINTTGTLEAYWAAFPESLGTLVRPAVKGLRRAARLAHPGERGERQSS